MANEKTVSASVEATPEDAERIGTLKNVFREVPEVPEVEIDPVHVTGVAAPGPEREDGSPSMVVIRVNQDVEDMSWVGAGRREQYTFVAGERYAVPYYIAQELERSGRIWH